MQIIRLIIAFILIMSGLFFAGVATFGLFRLKYVLNRIHAAAKCDTLSSLLILTGVAVLVGFSFTTLKILVLIVILWFTSPISAHMIGKVEFETDPDIEQKCEVIEK